MSKSPLVSIIIVNWNGRELLKDCLQTLKKISYPNWEVIFVDNGSTDGSEQLAEVLLKGQSFRLIKNDHNLGFAPANNQGLKIARGDYILLLNNDTKVPPDFLSMMIQKMEQSSEIGVIQPKIRLMEHPELLDNAGSFLTWTGFLQHWGFMHKDSVEFDKEAEIFSAKGACLLTRKQITDKVGLFDNDFFSYFEESDFCWKVWLLGYKVVYFPRTYIYHKLGATSKKMNQIMINYHSFKNRLRCLVEYLEFKNLLRIGLVHLVIYIGLAIYFLVKLEFKKTSMIISSLWWNISHLDQTLKQRRKIQHLRKVSDDELFKFVMKPFRPLEMLKHFKRVEANF